MKKTSIIPPLSVVRLVRADADTPAWRNQIGRTFRVGYYSRRDGSASVWPVNERGEYEQSVDQHRLLDYFVVIEKSRERSLYGANRPPIKPLRLNGHHGGTSKSSAFRVRSSLLV